MHRYYSLLWAEILSQNELPLWVAQKDLTVIDRIQQCTASKERSMLAQPKANEFWVDSWLLLHLIKCHPFMRIKVFHSNLELCGFSIQTAVIIHCSNQSTAVLEWKWPPNISQLEDNQHGIRSVFLYISIHTWANSFHCMPIPETVMTKRTKYKIIKESYYETGVLLRQHK